MRFGIVAFLIALVGCAGDVDEAGEQAPPNTEPNVGCATGCHGNDNSNAPPMGLGGVNLTTSVGVGAHEPHMNPTPDWHLAVQCADCHVVPAEVGSPGHIDGDNQAEVVFSMRAGAASAWNGTTCTTGCHGNAAWGGTKTSPTWTLVDGSQSQCGSCHGAPPPAPHPTGANCAACHPTMEENMLVFRDPASHINGKIDLVDAGATGGCTSCHGSAANAAPPKDLAGQTTSAKVGAHQKHLATSTWHHTIPCSGCHVVPLTQDSPGHRDGDNVAEVKFDALNPVATYAAGTCSSLYCHGNGRASNGTATWTSTTALACGGCHSVNGQNMSGDHSRHIIQQNMKCSECHATVVNAAMTIINANLHVDGVHQVKMANGTFNATTRQCANTGCHNTKTW